MKPRPAFINALILLFAISPLVYLLITWNTLPETVVTRFNFDQLTTKEQSRQSLLLTSILISVAAAGIYFLMRNLKMIDPKVKSNTPVSGFLRVGLSAAVLLVLLNYFYILSAVYSWEVSQKVIFIFTGLFVALLGNYITTIKPNFFAGIRIPWTLSDENNWRQTHHLAGKILFTGGLVLAILGYFLPENLLKPVFISSFVLMILIPCVYSYRLYKSKKHSSL